MEKKTTVSRGERRGIKAAHGTKWLIRKLKVFDKHCVATAKSKNRPGWLGHIPLIAFTLAVTAALAYFSLYILFIFGLMVILFSIVANIGNTTSEHIDSDVFFADTTFSDDGFRDGIEETGTYVGGHRIDD